MRQVLVLVAVTSAALAGQLSAQPPGISLPQPVGYINDFAGVLTPDAVSRLDDLARRLNAATRGDLVIVTLADLGDRPVEDVARQLGRDWKIGASAAIGDAARNAGVVLLIVPKETASDGNGRCRIEVGQGAEGFITDATAGSLCRAAVPQFQVRDYSGAVEFIAGTLASRYAEAFGVTLDGQPVRSRRGSSQNQSIKPFLMLLIVIVVFMVLSSRSGRRSGCLPLLISGIRMSGGGGGGFGGGFGGGGGGGFGGFGGGGGFSGGGGGSSW